jgi:hypothetical protein
MSGQRQTITLKNGEQVTVNARAAEQFKGFFNDLIDAGAPVRSLGGYGLRPGNPSQHPPGLAIDWAQHSRNVVDKDVQAWISKNPGRLNELEDRWGMSGGEHWKKPDTGHFSIQTLYGSEHLARLRDRGVMDRALQHNVTGTGKISVDVNAPKGTNVRASGGGLFKKTEVTRRTQMDKAPAQGQPATMGMDQ